jgi:dienelactone hydrolase
MTYLWYWPSGGYDFDAWRAKSDWQPVSGPQSGRDDPLPLARSDGTLEEWTRDRARWMALSGELLGRIEDLPPADPGWHVVESFDGPAYAAHRIRYRLTDLEWGSAWLLVPHGIESPMPAVIALHQTVSQGKDEPIGREGDPALAYGKDLAEMGAVVLAPDAIGFGERRADSPGALYHSAQEFFGAHPNGSVMGKMAFDVQRAVDLLERMPEVDAGRIGCIGHSHGGYGTLFAMIAEPRISAGVISCGITGLRTDPTPERWWRMTALIPRLGCYDSMRDAPIDFHAWIALVAPRPLFISAALQDAIFPNTGELPRLLDHARRIYRLHGASRNLRSWVFEGAHEFPPAARSRAYGMLTERLSQAAG